jgi:SHS2 domain-containing protein
MRESNTVPGVEPIDHVADLGVQIRAATLPALFDRAAAGLTALLREDAIPASGPVVEKEVVADADDVAQLLVLWLRELLYLRQVHGFEYRDARFVELSDQRVHARVHGARNASPPEREIKGVTYHALDVGHGDDGWHARVIFDV